MRILAKLGWAALVLLPLLVLLGLWKREEVQRLMAVNTLFDESVIVANFSNMGAMFLTAALPRAGAVSPLPQGPALTLPDGYDQWRTNRSVTSVLVLKNGTIRHEAYGLGTVPADLRISWSMAKSYLSALFGIAVQAGQIASLEDPVTKYAPTLIGSAYDGARILDVLQMSSGVEFDEDYLDFWSDINKMGRVLALGMSMDAFAEGLDQRRDAPGARMKYVSIDTHVLGMVLRGATGRSIPELLGEQIIGPLGQEADASYITDGHGTAFVLGGLNITTRDYARFGQMVLQDGAWNGAQIVPKDWLRVSTRASAKTAPGSIQYGYQWWIPADAPEDNSEFFARGVYGQYLYFDRKEQAVVVVTSADRKFREEGVFDESLAMLRALATAP